MRIVVDTKVFVSACLADGAPNAVIKGCLDGLFQPLIGNALFAEYGDVLGRTHLFKKRRPNLRTEGDNHFVELAVAGGAEYLVTSNLKNLETGQLKFLQLQFVSPQSFMKKLYV